jgi:G:T-mismatch repair DNA endonuclease (very short patch repair protein)
MGWQVLILWECETKCREELKQTLSQFLAAPAFWRKHPVANEENESRRRTILARAAVRKS